MTHHEEPFRLTHQDIEEYRVAFAKDWYPISYEEALDHTSRLMALGSILCRPMTKAQFIDMLEYENVGRRKKGLPERAYADLYSEEERAQGLHLR